MKIVHADFLEHAMHHFRFLEESYGFNREEAESRDEGTPDATTSLNYLNPDVGVGVKVILHHCDPYLGVALCELDRRNSIGKISFYGDSGFSRAMNLESLVEVKTDGQLPPIMPSNEAGITIPEIRRRMATRQELLNSRLEEVVRDLSDRLQKYGREVLQGDLRIFPIVQQFHRRKFLGA